DAVLRTLGTRAIPVFDANVAALKPALTALSGLADLVGRDLVALDEQTTGLRIRQGGTDVTAALTHRLLYSVGSFETYLVYWGESSPTPLDVELTVREAPTPKVRDPLTG